ncbi:MAG: rRNA maturation RNase YbeY [Lachnospiraceae bacterium]|nr:rRNA maturation RNase YbeY [Lachnospiraceae bacterium]
MTFYAENETGMELPFDWKEVFSLVGEGVLEQENCPYETEISLLLTDEKTIREMNRETRGIDQVTDVLSFPNLFFDHPGDFSSVEDTQADCFHPDTGELRLGEMVICMEKLYEQAESYGHSVKREFAFLVAHSMLHLCGYDHMEAEEETVMNSRQEKVLNLLGITREQL